MQVELKRNASNRFNAKNYNLFFNPSFFQTPKTPKKALKSISVLR